MKKTIFIFVALILLTIFLYLAFRNSSNLVPQDLNIKNSQQADEEVFSSVPGEIKVYSLKEGDLISSPLILKGEAKGNWFFEASFTVSLVDWDGRIIAEGIVTALSDWMTEDFVPFETELVFEKPDISADFMKNGVIIFRKSNPSGLPQMDKYFEIPITF